MEVESPEHTRDFAEVDINNGAATGSEDEEEEVPAPGSVTLDRNESDLFVSALSPSSIGDIHVSWGTKHGSSPHRQPPVIELPFWGVVGRFISARFVWFCGYVTSDAHQQSLLLHRNTMNLRLNAFPNPLQPLQEVLTDDGDYFISIVVSDPQKIGDGMGSYLAYK